MELNDYPRVVSIQDDSDAETLKPGNFKNLQEDADMAKWLPGHYIIKWNTVQFIKLSKFNLMIAKWLAK